MRTAGARATATDYEVFMLSSVREANDEMVSTGTVALSHRLPAVQ
jgi:hypothetical protein